MRILGLETSCDDTSAAVVEDGRLRSNVVSSQTALHAPYRGVVPELAARAHLDNLMPAVERALKQAGGKIDAVAYTRGPGLMGPLLIGKVAAQTLARLMGVPAVGVNHLEGHVLAAELEHTVRWPAMALVVSGGHTDLVLAKAPGRYRVLGRTRDDAAGEAYDKVARLLGLGYPGGPEIDARAAKGDPRAFAFPRPMLPGNWDFSFSGLKTSMLYLLDGRKPKGRELNDLCASFQEAVAETLVDKTVAAAKRHKAKDIVLGGGVAANSRLRAMMTERGEAAGFAVRLPARVLCTDNAAMIAHAAGRRLAAGGRWKGGGACDPALPLRSWA